MPCNLGFTLAFGVALSGVAGLACAQSSSAWFGGIGLTSDRIERGVSQSARKASLDAHLGWRHDNSGAYVVLGAATVSDEQYVGSDGYKLIAETGWGRGFGANGDWRAGALLRGHVFPGARGPWFGELPPRVQSATVQARDSDYQTVEAGLSLGWKVLTLSVTRSLTDYFGLSATESGPGSTRVGSRVIESTGTTYVGLDAAWPLGDRFTVAAGGGRLTVPNFEQLGYTDWRASVSYQWSAVRFSLQAAGSDASASSYRVRSRGGTDPAADKASDVAVTASLAWSF
jgi:Bacterial protein of unknown function (Gcw_chp)